MAHSLLVTCVLASLAYRVAGHSVCYPVYGCFDDNDPFHRTTGPLPQPPASLNTQFALFTRNHAVAGQTLNDLKNDTVQYSDFQPSRRTVVVTHGYLERATQFWFPPLINALLAHDDVNVIRVGWGNGAKFPYHYASSNTRLLGAQITHLLEVIQAVKGLDLARVQLIGFSVGAHAMGYVGRNFRRKGIVLRRITGLDPASPYFEYEHPDVRLDPTDAGFVDVIHSNSRLNGIMSLGCEQPLGHVDFYPNGGKYQPGCPDLRPEANLDLANIVACSHYRSILLYTESLVSNSSEFESYPCTSWENFKLGLCATCKNGSCPRLGYEAEKTSKNGVTGRFYLETFPAPPFSGVHYKITFHTGTGLFADLDSEVEVELAGRSFRSPFIELEKRYLPHGSTASFVVIVREDLGPLTDMSVKLNSLIEMWYVVKMEVTKLPTGESYGGCYQTYINSFSRKVPLFKNNHAC